MAYVESITATYCHNTSNKKNNSKNLEENETVKCVLCLGDSIEIVLIAKPGRKTEIFKYV